jgi:hypothetical protein
VSESHSEFELSELLCNREPSDILEVILVMIMTCMWTCRQVVNKEQILMMKT